MTSPYRKSTDTASRLPEPLPANPLPATVVAMPSTLADRQGDRQAQRQQPLDKVGDMLKRERERLGGDLQQIADYLRIRRAFLDALEHSRYEEFVADAYVIGFLRSYAEHLGLNSKQVVEQYRRERAGRRKQLTLSMPVPVSEGRAPSALILAGAAAAALLIYIGWYAFSTADRTTVIVPPAPPTLTSSDATPAADGTVPAAAVTAPDTANAPVPGATNAPPVASTPAATAADIVLPVTASAAMPATDPTFGTGAKTAAADTGKTAKAEQAKTGLVRDEAKAAAEGAATTATTTVATPAPATPTPAPRDETAALNAAEAAKLAGQTAAPAPAAAATGAGLHLTITAEEASWVLINDRNGKTVFDRIMQPNETYQVPNQAGLKLTTGNGSQIRLTLNGKALPPLTSNTSQILRNIPLDANGLQHLPAAAQAGAAE